MIHDNPQHNPTPTDPLDDELNALLAEEAADAQTPPDQLESKVLALTDPQLLSLLDEALAPEAAPHGLADSILAATQPGHRQHADAQRTGVLARIDGSAWRYAAAAAITLAAGVGLWLAGQNPGVDDGDGLAGVDDVDVTPPGDFIEEAETELLFASATESVEEVLTGVSERLDDYSISNDDIWSDMDGYELFLTELESS